MKGLNVGVWDKQEVVNIGAPGWHQRRPFPGRPGGHIPEIRALSIPYLAPPIPQEFLPPSCRTLQKGKPARKQGPLQNALRCVRRPCLSNLPPPRPRHEIRPAAVNVVAMPQTPPPHPSRRRLKDCAEQGRTPETVRSRKTKGRTRGHWRWRTWGRSRARTARKDQHQRKGRTKQRGQWRGIPRTSTSTGRSKRYRTRTATGSPPKAESFRSCASRALHWGA